MKNKFSFRIVLSFLSMALVISACSSLAPAPTSTATPEPTATQTLTPTITPTATATLKPTRTPDLAATQRYDEMYARVQEFREQGYISSAAGAYVELADFVLRMPKINYYSWDNTGKIATNFVFSAHFRWSTATKTPNVSGCGVVFALQEDGEHYFAVFLDKALLRFLQADGSGVHRLGKTSGSDVFKYDNPADANFTLVVSENHAYVFVDDFKVIVYTLPQNVLMKGELGLGLRSGTNKDYGTRCEMTDIRVWIAD